MINRFKMSVAAAALLAGTGFAYAQGAGGGMSQGGAAGQSGGASQSAPSSERGSPSAAPMNREGGAPGAKGAESREGAKGGMNNAQSKEGMSKDGMSKDSAQSKEGMSKDRAQSREGMSKDSAQSKEGMSKDGMSRDSAQSRDGKTNDRNAQSKEGMSKDGKSGATTGNAATSATAAPPAEKRTQISSAFRQEKVEETPNVNFNISIGTAVPRTVRYYPLPSRIVDIYPEWRGYDFIYVHGRYIVLNPETHEIVYIIES